MTRMASEALQDERVVFGPEHLYQPGWAAGWSFTGMALVAVVAAFLSFLISKLM